MARAPRKTAPAKAEQAKVPANYDYGEDADAGFEGTSEEDFLVPFLGVLQPLSPLVDEVKEAEPGQLFNTVTGDRWSGEEGVTFVPAITEHVFVEWQPRDEGGGGGQGFVGVHALDSEVVRHCRENQEFGNYKTEAGNDLVETFYVYGVRPTEDGGEMMSIAFSSTKIKPYKGWLTKARAIQVVIPDGPNKGRRITPPLFAHRYRLTTVKQENAKGKFWNFQVAFDGPSAEACRLDPESDLYVSARTVRDLFAEGRLRGDMASAEASGQGGGGDPDAPPF